MNKKSGFTLIELLVVITIIGLLASIVLASLNLARSKARDAKRISDLRSIRTALELYYDKNGTYPVIPTAVGATGWVSSADADADTPNSNWDKLQQALSPFISKLPKDPLNTGYDVWSGRYAYTYGYYVGTPSGCPLGTFPYAECSGQSYDLVTLLEVPNNQANCSNRRYIEHTFATTPNRKWCGGSSTNPATSPTADNYALDLMADH